jgi:hypothetical protein
MAKKAAAPKTRQRTMSDEHKAAFAEGREQGRVVRRYLEVLESYRPKRGRQRTPESIAKRLAAIDEQLASADPLNRLHLVEGFDLERELPPAKAAVPTSRSSRRPSSRLLPHTASERGSPSRPGGLPASHPESSRRLASAAGSRKGRERRFAHGRPAARCARSQSASRHRGPQGSGDPPR